SGGGSLEAKAAGAVTVGAGLGVPYFSLVGGGKMELEAKAKIGVTVGGQISASDESDISGQLSFKVAGGVTVEGTGSLVFDAVLPGDRVNLYTYEIGSLPIAKATVECEAVYSN